MLKTLALPSNICIIIGAESLAAIWVVGRSPESKIISSFLQLTAPHTRAAAADKNNILFITILFIRFEKNWSIPIYNVQLPQNIVLGVLFFSTKMLMRCVSRR
jgi:hypothetical protein